MLLADPDVAAVGSRLGTSRHGASGSFDIQLKTHARRPQGRHLRRARAAQRQGRSVSRTSTCACVRSRTCPAAAATATRARSTRCRCRATTSRSCSCGCRRLVKELAKNKMFRDVGSDVEEGGLRQNIVVDRDAASRLGISMGTIDGALYDAFGQRQVSTIYSDINQYKVVVNALPSQTATPEALNRIYVRSSSGSMVPITAVAHQEAGPGALADQPSEPDDHHGPELQPGARRVDGRGAAGHPADREGHAHAGRYPAQPGRRFPPLPGIRRARCCG